MDFRSVIAPLLIVALGIVLSTTFMHAKAKAPKVGDHAPDFTGTDQQGKNIHLKELFPAHRVVLIFYPKDESSVCTQQLCSVGTMIPKLPADVVVIGISSDSAASHTSFAAHHNLPFSLISDPKGKIRTRYGAYTLGFVPDRATIIINNKGIITHRLDGLMNILSAKKHIELLRSVFLGQ